MDRFREKVAEGVEARHSRRCAKSTSASPKRVGCSCSPSFRAKRQTGSTWATATFATLAEAVAWRAGSNRGAVGAPAEAPPLRLLAESFAARARDGLALTRSHRPYAPLTIESYWRALDLHVLPLLGDRPAHEIDEQAIRRVVGATAAKSGPSIARTAGIVLRIVLQDAFDQGHLSRLPGRVKLPAPGPGNTAHLSIAQADALIEAAAADDQRMRRSFAEPLVQLLAGTGCRIGEVLGLTWAAVDLDAPAVTVARETTKTDAGARRVPVEPEVASSLRRHFLASGRPEDAAFVFAREDGGRVDRGGRVRSTLARVAGAAGVDGVTPHVFRHSHASWLGSAGVPDAAGAARLGHADPAFYARRYRHALVADLEAAPALLSTLRRRAS